MPPAKKTPPQVLCNNAGVMALNDRATEDGFDVQMQVNHLGHYILTAKAMPALELAAQIRGEARIVNHSSAARANTDKKWPQCLDRKFLEKRPESGLGGDKVGMMVGGPWNRYQQTKLANVVFTYALRDRLAAAGSKVKALVAHPGIAPTALGRNMVKGGGKSIGPNWMNRIFIDMLGQSQEDGSMGITLCSLQPGVESGQFWGPLGKNYKFKVHNQGEYKGKAVVLPEEMNADQVARDMLWDVSQASTGEEILIKSAASYYVKAAV